MPNLDNDTYMQHKNITIVGGGPTGLLAALCLAKQGRDVTVFDAGLGKNVSDGRLLALSFASCFELDQLGVMDFSLATVIDTVHISHNGFGVCSIKNSDVNLEHLGYTIRYTALLNKLKMAVAKYSNISLKAVHVKKVIPGENYVTVIDDNENSCTADLVIMAEGASTEIAGIEYDIFDYEQMAVIASISPQIYHSGVAFERFEEDGPLVLLPDGNNYSLVWARSIDNTNNLRDPTWLMNELKNTGFMLRFGEFIISKQIHTYPLKRKIARQKVLPRVILVGNSAQTVHPISAQGLNIGIRDVLTLTGLLGGHNEIDNITCLEIYESLRHKDVRFVTGFTHFLVRFLEQQSALARYCRGVGMGVLNYCPPIRKILANSLIFGM